MAHRYAFEIAYNGNKFHGWQIQPNALSVQEEIEMQLSKLFGNIPVSIVGCGRTDAGVHASYYVFHADFELEIEDTEQLVYKLNKMLSEDVVVFNCCSVSNDFHARFSALLRTYHYFVSFQKKPFDKHCYYLNQQLDFELMNNAAKQLLGTQDFTSFSKLHTDVKTNICTVKKAVWRQYDTNTWVFEICADRFLRNMVRAIVGTLIEVGMKKIDATEIQNIIDAKNRSEAKLSVPAKGLFLANVTYPQELFDRSKH